MQKLKIILQSKLFLILLGVICVIYIVLNNYVFKIESIFNQDVSQITGIILDYKKKDTYISITLKAKEKIIVNYYNNDKKQLEESIKLGQYIKVSGSLQKASTNTIPNTFNYEHYLKSLKIYYVMKADKIKIQKQNTSLIYAIKNFFIGRIEKFNYAQEYYYTYLFANKSYIQDDIYQMYQDLGISHLFALSGMHISLFMLFLNKILKKLKLNKILVICICTLFIAFYMFLTNYSASVLRAGLLYILLVLNKNFKLNIPNINILLYTGIILSFINPFLINDIGFLYSFSATFGLMLTANFFKNKPYIFKLFICTIIATLFTLPICLRNFYEINLLSFISNIFFVPYISYIIYPLCLLSFIIKPLNVIFYLMILLLQKLALIFNYVNLTIVLRKMNILLVLVYYLILIMSVLKKKYWGLMIIGVLLLILKMLPYLDSAIYFYVLDVGQGDSLLLVDHNLANVILIDTGGKTYSSYNLSDNTITFLKSLGISKIDLLIITHGDADHCKEAVNIINNFKVDLVLLNQNALSSYENNIVNSGANVIYDYDFTSLNGMILEHTISDDENQSSLVLYFKLYNYKLLLMGDAPASVEKEILGNYNLDVDFIKLAHHGSKTSNSYEFLESITPLYAFISSGKNNIYNHPSEETLDTLNALEINYLDTQDVGTIILKITPKGYTIMKSKT